MPALSHLPPKIGAPAQKKNERNLALIVNHRTPIYGQVEGTMPNGTARTGRTTNELCSLNGQSDEALIKAIAAGNQAAMRILYARHNVRVYRFIARMVGDAGRAEDLVSEVFIDVWSQADRFESRSQVTTWILSIARFKALSALHRRRDAELDETAMQLIEDTADTPEQTILNIDLSAQLRTLFALMSREHREIIDLVYYREKSVEEVAEIIHMPKNTVKTRMFYARKRLEQLLSTHRDFDHLTAPRAA
jgi:RNA polymerase sigma-70 factor (ECF subfamily)